MRDGRTRTPQQPSSEMVPTLTGRATLATTLANPDITLARAAATYILFKRKRLTEKSELGYRAILDDFSADHPGAKLSDFDPPSGPHLVEDYLTGRYGHLAERTYNKGHSVLSDFFSWHVARGTLSRDPMGTIERAKARPVHRMTFTEQQCRQIFAKNPGPRDQVALRLLLHYAIRKGALRGVQLQHFNPEKRELVVFTKGETFHTVHVVEEEIWTLLESIREPGLHYLLPRTVTRRRTPPKRLQLEQLGALLQSGYALIGDAAEDAQTALDLADALDALSAAGAAVVRALEAASTQARVFLDEQMGEHGLHLWWYRCLTRAGVVTPGTTAGRRMHSARHTAIQRVLDKTGNLKAAQAVAGHANVATTGDTYTEWSPEQTKQTLRDAIGVGL